VNVGGGTARAGSLGDMARIVGGTAWHSSLTHSLTPSLPPSLAASLRLGLGMTHRPRDLIASASPPKITNC
jgi:hypothetical protein